eukprot:Nk52_evm40s1444 gene=Nk52_evmTU40s1444
MESFFGGSASTSKKASQRGTVPWVEKYRPKNVSEVSHQEEVVAVLKASVETGNLPHLLFYGPPGSGKTSTILAIARELYGPALMSSRVLELNASDERGINVIRTKVKDFAQGTAFSVASSTGHKCPPYKIIILDEADSMTKDAQSALRRTMEQHSHVTRFCLICNYVSRIIDPLASRCAKFRFKPLTLEAVVPHLEMICDKENVRCQREALVTLGEVSQGDLRRAITTLQSAHTYHPADELKPDDISEIAGVIPESVVTDLLKVCISKPFEGVQKAAKEVVLSGFSASLMLEQLHEKIVAYPSLNDKVKSLILLKLAKVDKCLVDGADEYLQILDFCSYIMNVSKEE